MSQHLYHATRNDFGGFPLRQSYMVYHFDCFRGFPPKSSRSNVRACRIPLSIIFVPRAYVLTISSHNLDDEMLDAEYTAPIESSLDEPTEHVATAALGTGTHSPTPLTPYTQVFIHTLLQQRQVPQQLTLARSVTGRPPSVRIIRALHIQYLTCSFTASQPDPRTTPPKRRTRPTARGQPPRTTAGSSLLSRQPRETPGASAAASSTHIRRSARNKGKGVDRGPGAIDDPLPEYDADDLVDPSQGGMSI